MTKRIEVPEDATSGVAQLQRALVRAFAVVEKGLVRRSTATGLAARVAAGQRVGAPPYGFRVPAPGAEMIPDEQQMLVVRHILRRRRGRASFRAIADELSSLGYATARGGTWRASTVQGIWKARARYRGL